MKFNLENLLEEYHSLEKELTNPEIFKDQKKVKEVSQRKKTLEKPVELYIKYKELHGSLKEANEIL